MALLAPIRRKFGRCQEGDPMMMMANVEVVQYDDPNISRPLLSLSSALSSSSTSFASVDSGLAVRFRLGG